MRPKKHEATREDDLFRARLDQIINTKHELVQLAGKIDWAWIDTEIAPLYSDKGRPGIESRFVVGLLLLRRLPLGRIGSYLGRWRRWLLRECTRRDQGNEEGVRD